MKRKCKKSGFTPLEIRVSNRGSKRFLTGFTIVELLTVLAIIAVLTGILIPSLNLVRNIARETRQRAQFATIDQALMAFRSDYGNYPPSSARDMMGAQYCGAQKLAEALVGWDLLGFHPDSAWRADGYDGLNGPWTYDPEKVRDNDGDGILDTLYERVGPYLDVATANAFTLRQVFGRNNLGWTSPVPGFNEDNFVICDSFGVRPIPLGERIVRVGTPILYYRADTTRRRFGALGIPPGSDSIYKIDDNFRLIMVADLEDGTPPGDHPLFNAAGTYFYSEDYKIVDQKILQATGRYWPYRADSYILISAGADGLYGTNDDITNFGN